MRIHYKGKFDGNYDKLPFNEHIKDAVPFVEAKTPDELINKLMPIGMTLQILSIIAIIFFVFSNPLSFIGVGVAFLLLLPHEFLHAICFKEDAYIYTNLRKGMLFVVGPETMSKSRFILMSLLPNIIFGAIPLIIFALNNNFTILATMGFTSIPLGIGDYYNVYNAITQMPKGARTYIHKFNSYWYIP